MRTQFVRLETIMLDSIKLFADSARMPLPYITNALEVSTMRLRAFGQALVQQSLEAVAVQGMLVFDLGVAVTFHALNLTQVLGVRGVRTTQHLELTTEL